MNNRGMLSEKLQQKSQAFLKRCITIPELRLYPYIDYCIKNACQGWDYANLNEKEMIILAMLMKEHHIAYSPEKIIISREFYNFIQDIMAISYVEQFL